MQSAPGDRLSVLSQLALLQEKPPTLRRWCRLADGCEFAMKPCKTRMRWGEVPGWFNANEEIQESSLRCNLAISYGMRSSCPAPTSQMNDGVRLIPFSHPDNHKGGRENLVTLILYGLTLCSITDVANQSRWIGEPLHPQIVADNPLRKRYYYYRDRWDAMSELLSCNPRRHSPFRQS